MADTLQLTSVSPLRPWNATGFSVFQGTTDYAEFRFIPATGSPKAMLRLVRNGDVRFYGELLLDDGALRSVNAFTFTSASSGLIASFRTGSDPSGIGTEVYNFDGSGRLTVVSRMAGATGTSPTLVLDGTGGGGRSWTLKSNASTGTLDISVAPPADPSVNWGVDGTGIDQRWYGDTPSAYLQWDQSANALTFAGVAHAVYQTLSAPNGTAIPVTHSGSLPITQNGAETNTLADPTFIGQWLSIFVDTDTSGQRVITAASRINSAGKTVITLSNVGNFIKLEAITVGGALKWQVVANDGATLT